MRLIIFILGLLIYSSVSHATTYVYEVNHSVFGYLGSYINEIKYKYPDIQVHNVVHFKAYFFGNLIYKEDSDRHEIWRNGHLVAFNAVSNKNNNPVYINGNANSGEFVFSTPLVSKTSVDIQPENIWTEDNIKNLPHLMFHTDTGAIVPVIMSGPYVERSEYGYVDRYNIRDDDSDFIILFRQKIPIKILVKNNIGTSTFILTKILQ